MSHRSAIFALTLILIFCAPAMADFASSPVLREPVRQAAADLDSSAFIDVLISFDNELDPVAVKATSLQQNLNRKAAYRLVFNRLEQNRTALEQSLSATLEAMGAEGSIESHKFYTVSRTILVRSRVDNLDRLAQLPGVRLINLNSVVSLVKPVEEYGAASQASSGVLSTALEAVNIRPLWQMGLTGAGTLICSFDTGVDGVHPALASKWRGNNGASSQASWFGPHDDDLPVDDAGHGTHVMGIMVGGTDTDTIGVAFNAQWITAGVIDQGADFTTTIADILDAFEWALNPDGDPNTMDDVPDVICNSWGVPRGVFDACDNTFWTAIDNVEAAGIVTVFAAGNEGPTAGSIRNPADRASSPLNTLAVGAINATTMTIADFSSRGPAGCDGSIKPELVAPGVGIYSTYKGSTYKIMSGTSMAAPFVAGLAALIRQYNPDATVEEIKNALLSATTDLGEEGEDNSYGRGLIDASRLLDYITAPSRPPIQIYRSAIVSGDDGFADPGDSAELNLTLNDPTGLADSAFVWLAGASDHLTILPDTARFYFAEGSYYALSLTPLRFVVDSNAISGATVELAICVLVPAALAADTVKCSIVIGRPLPGVLYDAGSGQIQFTVSDFGQFGFGPGSIYQAGGEGFRLADGDNLLYEAGLIVGRGEQQVSDAIRGEDAEFKESDFVPDVTISLTGDDTGVDLGYGDDEAVVPIPVDVSQTVYRNEGDFIIMEFTLTNPTADRIEPLSFGLFFDFDLDRFGDRIGFDSLLGMVYQFDSSRGEYVGLLGLSVNSFAFVADTNLSSGKRGFDKTQKYQMISGAGLTLGASDQADWYLVISQTIMRMDAFASRTIAVAAVGASSLEELQSLAREALAAYDMILDTDNGDLALPGRFELYQNYPNPFNPTTTIRFALENAADVHLTVHNVAGQKVRTLADRVMPAGEHEVIWDGCDEGGHSVASGIYLYRLQSEEGMAARKMVLLK